MLDNIEEELTLGLHKLWDETQNVTLFYLQIPDLLYSFHNDWTYSFLKPNIVKITFKFKDSISTLYNISIDGDLTIDGTIII